MALLKVLLLLGLGVSVKSDVSLQKRIIGGKDCANIEHLHHVRLESSNGTHVRRCGGSLIHPQWILTAAQCYNSEPGWTNEAVLKVHPRTAGQQRQKIQQAPEIYTILGRNHDIMMLKLETPVTDVPLAQLPDCNDRLNIDYFVQLAGEGATTTGSNNQQLPDAPIPAHLQCVDMKIVRLNLFKHGFLFRAEAPNKDICFGDAGGGVMYNNMIYGVISFGGADACQRPVGILNLCEYKAWIRRKIERG